MVSNYDKTNFELLLGFLGHFWKSGDFELLNTWTFLSETFSKSSSLNFVKHQYKMSWHGPYLMSATPIFQKQFFFKNVPKISQKLAISKNFLYPEKIKENVLL